MTDEPGFMERCGLGKHGTEVGEYTLFFRPYLSVGNAPHCVGMWIARGPKLEPGGLSRLNMFAVFCGSTNVQRYYPGSHLLLGVEDDIYIPEYSQESLYIAKSTIAYGAMVKFLQEQSSNG